MTTLADLPVDAQLKVAMIPANGVALLPQLDLAVERSAEGELAFHCIKCYAHKLIAEVAPGMAAPYEHQFTHPFAVMKWDVAKAWRLARSSGRQPQRLDPEWIKGWLTDRSFLVGDHIDHLPPEVLDQPVLCDLIWVEATVRDSGVPVSVPFPMLIDGHHRAARATRDGIPLLGYVLSPAEHNAVVTYEPGRYEPELMGWLTREQAEALPGIEWDAGTRP